MHMNQPPKHVHLTLPKRVDDVKWNKQLGDILITMVGLPVKVLCDEYHWDDARLEQVADDITYGYQQISEDQMDFETVTASLKDESGIEMDQLLKKYNVLSTDVDVGFMLTCSISVMVLLDTQGFTDEQAKEYADHLVHYYTWVRRKFITSYDLRQCLKIHCGYRVVKGTMKEEENNKIEE